MIQLVTFRTVDDSTPRTGLLHDGRIHASGRYAGMQDVLEDWDRASERLASLEPELAGRTPVAGAELLAPLPRPRNIFFAGVNYRDHVLEMTRRLGLPLEQDPKARGWRPWFSTKATGDTVVGPAAVVRRPDDSAMLDWELELAVVIGRRTRGATRADALAAVAGYTIANDLSAREHVSRAEVPDGSPFKWDWIGQKSFDGACPMGPAITPASMIGDPMTLEMKLWVGDELMQHSNTSEMLFDIADQIVHLAARLTLQPGNVILTGTPAGVGMARQRFLQPGEVVRQWIQGIGEFSFTIA